MTSAVRASRSILGVNSYSEVEDMWSERRKDLCNEAPGVDCIAVEIEAGRRGPYRRLGSQIHVIASAR